MAHKEKWDEIISRLASKTPKGLLDWKQDGSRTDKFVLKFGPKAITVQLKMHGFINFDLLDNGGAVIDSYLMNGDRFRETTESQLFDSIRRHVLRVEPILDNMIRQLGEVD